MSDPEVVTVPLRTLIEFVGTIHNNPKPMTPAGIETAVRTWVEHAQRDVEHPLPRVPPGGSVH